MEHDHLSIVNGDDADGTDRRGEPAARQTPRLRPQRTLPTERLKLDTQTAALRAFVRASNRGAIPVGAREVAARIQVSDATAALVNTFFVEAGFVNKAGKGKYLPVPEVIEYARLYSLDKDAAVDQLAGLLKNSWYYEEVAGELVGGESSTDTLTSVLAHAAAVGGERRAQLSMIIEWLHYVRLIDVQEDGGVTLGTAAAPPGLNIGTIVQREDETPAPTENSTPSQKPTEHRGTAPSPVLAFRFEFSLTADDLAKLSPAQIAATFEAVGKVIAIKAEAGIA